MPVALLVASPGGHIDELWELAQRLPAGTDRLWVTARTPQTESLLSGVPVIWVPPVGSRQLMKAATGLGPAMHLFRTVRPHLLITTGAALAAPYLVAAASLGIETHYVESATRFDGPSLTGRLASILPHAGLYHQMFTTPGPRWRPVRSVFDGFSTTRVKTTKVHRVAVSLGTERFPFIRLVRMLEECLLPDVGIVWQLGHTPDIGCRGQVHDWMPADRLACEFQAADAVVTHAGVGSVLTALRAGKHPVIVPRLAHLGEHVDDHQQRLADVLGVRGLVTVGSDDPQDLASDIMRSAGQASVHE